MAHNADLEKIISDLLKSTRSIKVKKMFGGICYMHRGNMLCGIDHDRLMVRVGPDQYEAALKLKFASVMDITGKPMRGFIFVRPDGLKSKKQIDNWIQLGLNFTKSLKVK